MEVGNVRWFRLRLVSSGWDGSNMHLATWGTKEDLLTVIGVLPVSRSCIAAWNYMLANVLVSYDEKGARVHLVLDSCRVFNERSTLFEPSNA